MANLIGKEIGKYRITERIGRGGMAEVYLGSHILLDKPVAIKVLHGFLLEGEEFIERFTREAKAVANLRHHNIVQVFDFEIQDEIIFMVMEYIAGTNLQKELVRLGKKGARFTFSQIGSVIGDIAGALDYAHTREMLHRDVKPSNILIDKEGKAYLTDFGIARILGDHRLTTTGTLIGTPAYMSPEQCLGKELTEQSDIYSLGIIAFEMLTGQVPYDAKTPVAVIHKQISAPIPEIKQFGDGLFHSIQEVINKALAKSPSERFASAQALAIALKTAFTTQETSVTPSLAPTQSEPSDERFRTPTVIMDESHKPSDSITPMDEIPKLDEGPEEVDYDQPTVLMKEEQESADTDKLTELMDQDEIHDTVIDPGPADYTTPTLVMEEQDVSEPSESFQTEELVKDHEGEVEVETPRGKRWKIPVWGWITAVIVLVGILVLGLTQMVGTPKEVSEIKPTRTSRPTATATMEPSPEPTAMPVPLTEPVAFTFTHGITNTGLTLLSGGDMDTKMIEGEDGQSWRSGNGQVLPATDGNNTEDFKIAFDFDDNQVYQIPDEAVVLIKIQYLDVGGGGFSLVYDAHSTGSEQSDSFTTTDDVIKTGSGEKQEILFILRDAAFANGWEGADFIIDDQGNGAEEIWSVQVEIYPPMDGEGFFNLGERLYNQGYYKEANEFFDDATAAGYETTNLYDLQAQAYVALGQIDEALSATEKALEIDHHDARILTTRGEIYWEQLGDEESAAKEFDLAVAYNGQDPLAYYIRGHFAFDTEQYDLCIQDFSNLISLDAENAWAPLKRGDCYAGRRDLYDARTDYKSFLVMTAGDSDWSGERSRVTTWLSANEPEVVEVLLDADHPENGISIIPFWDHDIEMVLFGEDQVQTWRTGNGRALPASDENSRDDNYMAFDIDDDLIYRVPEDSMVRIVIEYLDEGLDLLCIQYDSHTDNFKSTEEIKKTNSGIFMKAEFLLTDAFFVNQEHAQMGHGYDFRLDDLGDGAETIKSVTVTSYPKLGAEENYEEGYKVLNQRDPRLAIEYFNLAIKGGHESPSLYSQLSFAYIDIGEIYKALDTLDKGVELYPNDVNLRVDRGNQYWIFHRDAELAEQDYTLAIELAEDDPGPYDQRGHLYYETKQFDLCVQDYTVVISLDPDNPWGPLGRGDCYVGLGEFALAKADYETFLSLSEDDPQFAELRDRVQTWLDYH